MALNIGMESSNPAGAPMRHDHGGEARQLAEIGLASPGCENAPACLGPSPAGPGHGKFRHCCAIDPNDNSGRASVLRGSWPRTPVLPYRIDSKTIFGNPRRPAGGDH